MFCIYVIACVAMCFLLVELVFCFFFYFFFFKQKTAYEMRISDWSSDVCSSDLFPRQSGTLSQHSFGRAACLKSRSAHCWGTPTRIGQRASMRSTTDRKSVV